MVFATKANVSFKPSVCPSICVLLESLSFFWSEFCSFTQCVNWSGTWLRKNILNNNSACVNALYGNTLMLLHIHVSMCNMSKSLFALANKWFEKIFRIKGFINRYRDILKKFSHLKINSFVFHEFLLFEKNLCSFSIFTLIIKENYFKIISEAFNSLKWLKIWNDFALSQKVMKN